MFWVGGCASAPTPGPAPVAAHVGVPTPQAQATAARAKQVEQLLAAGHALAAQHKPAEAEVQLRRAVQLGWGFGEPWSRYRADGLAEIARGLFAQQRTDDARTAVVDALKLLKPGPLADDQRIAELETTRAESFRYDQRADLAVAPFRAAVQAAARHPAELGPALIALSLRLSDTLQGLGQLLQATKTLEAVLGVAKSQGPAQAESVARTLAPLYDAGGEPRRAQELLTAFGVTTATQAGASGASATSGASGASATSGASAASGAPSGPISNRKELVAMQADFRACYRASLATNGDVQGRVDLVLQVAADGRVINVKADRSGLPAYAVDCLLRRASIAQFEPPMGGATVLTVPVTFVKQQND